MAPDGTAVPAVALGCMPASVRSGSADRPSLGSGRGTRGRDRILLAAVRGRGRSGRSAPVLGGGRPVRVQVARSAGDARRCLPADAVAAGEHATPRDASRRVADGPSPLTLDVPPAWRSGYYEVVLEIDVGGKVRRDPAFFVVRPPPGTRIVLALATNTWHAYNDFGGPTCTPEAPRSQCDDRWPRGICTSPPARDGA